MENLTPQLNETQLKQNIDTLISNGVSRQEVQSYVNNYSKDESGSYVLKTSRIQQGQQLVQERGEKGKEYVKNVVGAYKEAGKDIQEGIKSGAGQMQLGMAEGGLKGAKDQVVGAARGGLRTVGAIAEAAFAPITEAIKPLVEPAITKLAENPKFQHLVNPIIEYANKHPEAAKDIQNIIDIATLGVGGAVEKPIVSAVEQGAKTAVETGASLTKEALQTGAKVVGKTVDVGGEALSGIAKGTKVVTEPLTTIAKDTLKPENIMQRVARVPKGEQVKFQKMTGESVGEYLTKRDIFGNEEQILTKLYDTFSKSKDTADEALATLKGTYKPKQVGTALSELIKREAKVSSPGALSKDAKALIQFQKKYKTDGLTMTDINAIKRLYERNVKLGYLKEQASDKIAHATNLDTSIREWQLSQAEKLGLENLGAINKETQAAKSLLDSLGKEAMGQAGNNALGLTDAVLISGGDPTAIGMLVAKKILSAKGIQSEIAKRLSKNLPKKAPVKAKFGKPKPDFLDFVSK